MTFSTRFLSAVVAAGLLIAPSAQADNWQHHHHNNNAASAAIVGGLVGLGVGAAIASNGGYYGWPGYSASPYGYHTPPPAYYTPAPPPAYYGYGPGYGPGYGYGYGY